MRHQGRITTWKDDIGFGFITPKGGGVQLFVHINSFSSRPRRPEIDELVTYELELSVDRTVTNAVAICPNCHRRLHFTEDSQAYRQSVYGKVTELEVE